MMAIAVAIDASDGTLARALRVRERIPFFDGALLDNIVDYLNYVAIPIFLMMRARILPPTAAGETIAGFAMIASAYGFSRVDAKTEDNYFRGFPSYWNLVALYLYCLGFAPILNAAIVALLALMVFVPIKYIYPNRTELMRPLTLTLAAHLGGGNRRDAPDAAGSQRHFALHFARLRRVLFCNVIRPACASDAGCCASDSLIRDESYGSQFD